MSATLVITLSNRSSTEVETSNLVDVAFANPPNLKRSPLMSPIRVVYGRATRSIDRLKLSGSRRRVSVPPNAALRALIPIRCYCDTGTDPLPLHPLPGSYPITLHYDRNHKGTKASQAFDAVVQIDEPHGEDAEVFRVIQGNVELQKALANAKAKVSRTTLMQLQELCRLYPGSRYADSLHATVVNVICGTLGTRLPTNSNTTSMRASLSHTSTKSGAHEVFERIDEYGFHPACGCRSCCDVANHATACRSANESSRCSRGSDKPSFRQSLGNPRGDECVPENTAGSSGVLRPRSHSAA